jgi:hypothetical protein
MLACSLGFAFSPVAAALLRGQTREFSPLASNATPIDANSIQEGKLCIAEVVGGGDILLDEKMPEEYVRGMKTMAKRKVIVAGLVRQMRGTIHRLFRELQATGKMFMKHHIILLESGSTDGDTKPLLRKLCNESPTESTCLVLDEAPQMTSLPRIAHFTKLRQQLLDTIRLFVSTSKTTWDYVLMLDGDIFEGPRGKMEDRFGFSSAALPLVASATLPEAPDSADQFDLVCANSIRTAYQKPGLYRDTFALRESSWSEKRAHHQRHDPIQRLYKGREPVRVLSCFSGIALYSWRALESSACNYTYYSEDVCEHVSLHKCMSQHGFGKVAIHPSWSVTFDNPVPQVCQSPPSL